MIKIIRGEKILTLSTGNMKLKADKNNKFLIWSIPAEKTCPYSTELCRKYCYAKKAERLYKNTRDSRLTSYEESLKDSFITDMTNTIKYHLNKRSFQGKNVYFRIHESGDFYNRTYVKKWIEIIKKFPQVQFLAYTKSLQYFTDIEVPENMVVRASVWTDTEKRELKLIEKLELPIFTAFDKKEIVDKLENEGYSECGGSCKDCKKCYTNKIKKIAIKIH